MSLASDLLHERVREFARQCLTGVAPGDGFESLALSIARHQAEHHPVIARLLRYHGSRLLELEDVPAVPADAFRRGRVAAHPPEQDVARFQTSGTTGGAGVHAFRTLTTYRQLSVSWGRRALLGAGSHAARATVLALAPPFEPERVSSLGYMMQELMRELDGRGLDEGSAFDGSERGRWLLAPAVVDVEALRRGAEIAARRGEGLILLGTSFALVWLLEALDGTVVPLPPGSVVMRTGGFKGHVRAVDDATLAERVAHALGVEPARIIGEYGMTELSSQLYDGGAAGGGSVYVPPPWLRVTPVDPVSLCPVPDGDVGLARFTDLGNIDSALNVLTQDRVRRVGAGITLLGRQPGARLRGCSLAAEALSSAKPGAGPGAQG